MDGGNGEVLIAIGKLQGEVKQLSSRMDRVGDELRIMREEIVKVRMFKFQMLAVAAFVAMLVGALVSWISRKVGLG